MVAKCSAPPHAPALQLAPSLHPHKCRRLLAADSERIAYRRPIAHVHRPPQRVAGVGRQDVAKQLHRHGCEAAPPGVVVEEELVNLEPAQAAGVVAGGGDYAGALSVYLDRAQRTGLRAALELLQGRGLRPGAHFGPLPEVEGAIIRERQAEGIARAKARGVYKGRTKALSDEQLAQARKWVSEGIPKAEVARRLNVGRTTLR